MNRKLFVLAFVSAAFFFGCSADGLFPEGNPGGVVWSKDFKGNPDPNPNPDPGNTQYCHISMGSTDIHCEEIDSYYTTQDCQDDADLYSSIAGVSLTSNINSTPCSN